MQFPERWSVRASAVFRALTSEVSMNRTWFGNAAIVASVHPIFEFRNPRVNSTPVRGPHPGCGSARPLAPERVLPSRIMEALLFVPLLLSAVAAALAQTPAVSNSQRGVGHFDGSWTTKMACDASEHMPAYSWTFVSTISNSAFHGQHGEEGGPGYLVVDGPINTDGSAKLHAKGKVQSGKAGIVTQLKGNKYDYYIEAKFTDTTGAGKRDAGAGILGRPCTFEFTKETQTPAEPSAAPPSQ